MGATVRKKIIPIINGATIAPKIIPNLNQSLFNGAKSFGLINPKIRKTKATVTDQILIGPSYVKGHKLIIKKIMKKTRPKFLFELIFILFINFVILILS